MQKILILGRGYTGGFLEELLLAEKKESKVYTTRRNKGPIQFLFEQRQTWSQLPDVEATFWTFPAAPPATVKEFYQNNKKKLGKLIVIGSTGHILCSKAGEIVKENSPLDLNQERVQGEEFLRDKGAIIVRAAGIYGPGRDPRRWFERGLLQPGERRLNLVHVEDLCRFLLQALQRGETGAHYLAADGKPASCSDLFNIWKLDLPEKRMEKPVSGRNRKQKIVDPAWSIKELGIVLKFKDVFAGVDSLEQEHKR
ncbi:hypothetical protein ACFL35_18530 [Candidatus Riflebacteria bacterium]